MRVSKQPEERKTKIDKEIFQWSEAELVKKAEAFIYMIKIR